VNVQLAELDLRRAAPRLQRLPAEEVLREVVQAYAPDVALSCSFGGPSGMVLVDMLARLDLLDDVEVYYLDTGLLFQATHEARERIERRYGFEATAYHAELSLSEQAARHGDALWGRDPNACCGIRKVGPNARALADKRAWITGVRRDQSAQRAATPVLEWDAKFGLVKVAPLSGWSEAEIWEYIQRHDVPYNRLHDEGYPSLGCDTRCTSRPLPGESLRSGRWRGLSKTECGLHGNS
jgi:phosphoadenosine phosphosulfate reductase